ncbi:hypothetical protein [Candidatus Electronema sp. TJ]|uniref:hypothetical protein n=1 Tax=Candidatus Electronema sp. TJ TaxID=3401573 RepID=UPI003AA86ADF
MQEIHAVTGAFGFSGKYLARRRLAERRKVITLTNSFQGKNSFGSAAQDFPFHVDAPPRMTEPLRGVSALCKTCWVRFNHRADEYQSN